MDIEGLFDKSRIIQFRVKDITHRFILFLICFMEVLVEHFKNPLEEEIFCVTMLLCGSIYEMLSINKIHLF